MPAFRRRSGESSDAWAHRLRAVDADALTEGELDELTLWRLKAARAAGPVRAAPGEGDALRRCQECIRRLSARDRRELLRWIRHGTDV